MSTRNLFKGEYERSYRAVSERFESMMKHPKRYREQRTGMQIAKMGGERVGSDRETKKFEASTEHRSLT